MFTLILTEVQVGKSHSLPLRISVVLDGWQAAGISETIHKGTIVKKIEVDKFNCVTFGELFYYSKLIRLQGEVTKCQLKVAPKQKKVDLFGLCDLKKKKNIHMHLQAWSQVLKLCLQEYVSPLILLYSLASSSYLFT